MDYLWCFLCGGLLCAVGQVLIDLTKLTPARILSGYVVAGVILQAVGVYQPLVDWAGAGATVPLTGFGYSLAKGVAKAVEEFQEWQRSIGRDINPMELIARLRAAGVKRVELRQPVDKVIENGMDSGKAVVQIPKLSGTPTIIYGGIEDD